MKRTIRLNRNRLLGYRLRSRHAVGGKIGAKL